MGNFIVSARKYRPDTFSSVVGQDSITVTLRNAIRNNFLAHAYLFCGQRGVGKTTCARIFAKTINCSNPTPDYEPCNQCESCISFNQMRAFNIHELDAASNNSVEDIRNLIDQVRIPPQIGKYSIYIIDEVHMLSAQAFNTFLKTLEEPPFHAIFILATTEKQKIIPTILSRCQIFDFNRIKVHDIVAYLTEIAGKESIEYESDALNIIALKADGALRDALSIFDQMVSYTGKKITYKDVIENLNILDYDYYFRITDAFLTRNVNDSLLIFNEILGEGFDGHNFIVGLGGHFRDLLVSRDPETLILLETGTTISERYKEQSVRCEPDFLYKSLEICSTTDIHYKASRNQKLHIELALIKLCQLAEEKKKVTPETKPAREESSNSQAGEAEILRTGEEKFRNRTSRPLKRRDSGTKEDLPLEDSESAGLENHEAAVREELSAIQADKSVGEHEQQEEVIADEDTTEQESQEQQESVQEVDETEDDEQFHEFIGKTKEEAEESSNRTLKGRIFSSMYSIKDALTGNSLQKNESEDITESAEIKLSISNKPFSSNELIQVWDEFAEKIKTDRPRMYNTLKGHLPELMQDNEISLILDNTVQHDEFQQDIKQDMLTYLRKTLKNDLIMISTSVKTVEKNQTKFYTSEEKYDHMIKKNPDLGKLKQEFNLDFE